MSWKLRGRVLDFQDRCQIMAVLNVTPDSFYDGGCYLSPDSAVERALEMEGGRGRHRRHRGRVYSPANALRFCSSGR